MAEQWFQKAAVALLLSAPSTLHKAYWSGKSDQYEDEVNRLPFSPEGKEAAMQALADLRDHAGFLHATSEALKTRMWAGSEPHPSDADAEKIVRALRDLDGV